MGGAGVDRYRIAARMERLPLSPWHHKLRLVVGSVNFSDAFDALTIAYVLPALIPLWHIVPSEIGLLISIGYAGQVIGAVLSGYLAERYGRVPLMIANLLLFTLMSFACILAQNFSTLLVLRFLQGFGLGGEVPIANTYVSEFAQSSRRGRFVLLQQLMFPVGLTTVALVGVFVVPHWGWQWMFVLGALPALLALPMIRVLPESPRWLASRGRFEDADRVVTHIEALVSAQGARPLPPIPENVAPVVAATPRFGELFAGIYRRRTLSLWVLWFCAYGITYALTGWLPSIMRTVYHLPVGESNLYGFVVNITGLLVLLLAAFTIDRIGRKRAYSYGFLLAAVPLLVVVFCAEPRAVCTCGDGDAGVRRHGHDPRLARHVHRGELPQPSAGAGQRHVERASAAVVSPQSLYGRHYPAALRRRRRLRDVRRVCSDRRHHLCRILRRNCRQNARTTIAHQACHTIT